MPVGSSSSVQLKKGNGACDYKLWLDSEEAVERSTQVNESTSSSLLTLTCIDVSPASSDLVEECNIRSGVGQMDTSPEEIYYHISTFPATTGPVKSRTVIFEDLIGEDEVLDEPSRKHRKRLRYGELKVGDTSLLSSIGCVQLPATNSRNCLAEERLHLSLLESEGEIHPIQTEVRKLILVEVSDAFPPERIFILQDAGTDDDDASPVAKPRNLLPTETNICTMLTVGEDVQILGSVKNKSDGKSYQGGERSSTMRCSISKGIFAGC